MFHTSEEMPVSRKRQNVGYPRTGLVRHVVERYKNDPNIRGIFLYGGYATGRATAFSDLDVLLIVKKRRPFVRYDGPVFVEIFSERLQDLPRNLGRNPMFYYPYAEVRGLHDPENLEPKIRAIAESFRRAYRAPSLLKGDLYIQLWTLRSKLRSALSENDEPRAHYLAQIALGTCIAGLCAVNDLPPWPENTAWRYVASARKVPRGFQSLWNTMVAGQPHPKIHAILRLIEFLLGKLRPAMNHFPGFFKPLRELSRSKK